MKLDEFLEELILEQEDWTHERFLQEKDGERMLKNKYKALIDRLNLLFVNLPDTYSASAINIEGTDMFPLCNIRLSDKELKTYNSESKALGAIFMCILLLYDRIYCAGNLEFLKKFYFKAEKLFIKIGLNPYKSDYWRKKAIIRCIEMLDNAEIDLFENNNVGKIWFDMIRYEHFQQKIKTADIIRSQLQDKNKLEISGREKIVSNRFGSLLCKHPELNKLYEKYKDAQDYYKKKLFVSPLDECIAPYGKIDTFRYIGDQYNEELTEIEYEFFKLLFKIIPLKERGSGTKNLMKKLREEQWESVSIDDRNMIIEFIDKLFELNSPLRLTRYFRYKTFGEIENKAKEIRFMLSDPVRYRVTKSLAEMLLLVRSESEASEEFLYEFENTLKKPYSKYMNRNEELLQLILDDEHDIYDGTLNTWVKRNEQLSDLILNINSE